MRMQKFISVVLVFLVLSLPVTGTLSITEFSGEDNFEGFAKPSDTLTVAVDASLPDQDVSADNLRLKYGSLSIGFDQCLKAGDIYSCSYETLIRGGRGKVDYSVVLSDDSGAERDSVSQSLTIDYIGAEVVDLKIDPEVNTGQFDIVFAVEDYGSFTGDTDSCVGLDKLEIYDGPASGSPVEEVLLDGSCEFSDIFTYDASSSSREGKICAKAYDLFGQSKNVECVDFEVDADDPFISDLELLFNDVPLTHITSDGVRADVVVSIDDAVDSSVFADLSALASDNGVEVEPSYISGDTFVWYDVFVDSDCEVTFSAEDEVGNGVKETLFCDLEKDDSPPAFSDFQTFDMLGNELTDVNGNLLLGKKGIVVAKFNEPGIGMSKGNAFLDLSGIGRGTKVRADNCNLTGGSWRCVWEVSPLAGGSADIAVTKDTKDDLGNAVPLEAREILSADLTPPVIGEINFSVTHVDELLGDAIVKGDAIEFYVPASGFSIIVPNLSALGIDAPECLAGAENFTCAFGGTIAKSGTGGNRSVNFITYDDAGNSFSKNVDVPLFGLLNDTSPDFWGVDKVLCSPKTIDRSITPLINTRVYCGIELEAVDDEVESAGFSLGNLNECEGFGYSLRVVKGKDDAKDVHEDFTEAFSESSTTVVLNVFDSGTANSSKKYVLFEDRPGMTEFDVVRKGGITDYFADHPLMMNNAPTSENPFAVFVLANSKFDIDGLYLNCPLYITSKVGEDYTQFPEVENITFDFGFYNLPLGEVSGELYEKIDDAIEQAEVLGEWVDDVTQVFEYVQKICEVRGVVWNVINAVETVLNVIGHTIPILFSNPATTGNAKELNIVKQTVCSKNSKAVQALAGDGSYADEKTGKALTNEDLAKQYHDSWGKTVTGFFEGVLGGQGTNKGLDGTILKPLCDFVNCRSTRCPPEKDEEGDWSYNKGAKSQKDLGGVECGIRDIVGFAGGAQGYVGSGRGISGATADFFTGRPNTEAESEAAEQGKEALDGSISPKTSLFWAVMTMCIPGIFYNLKKLRQVYCSRAVCLGQGIKDEGIPVSVCEDQYSTMLCTFIVNQVFNIVPQVQTFNYYIGLAQEIVANPAAAVSALAGQFCGRLCEMPPQQAYLYSLCSIPKLVSVIGRVIEDVMAIEKKGSDYLSIAEGPCDKMQDLKDEIKKKQDSGEKLKPVSAETPTKGGGFS